MVRLKGAEDLPMYFGTSVEIMKRASRLRKDQTSAEKIIWQRLRRRQIGGLRFRRQHPINSFIADFYCHEAKIVIEIDGGIHDDQEQKQKDIARQEIITDFGIKVLRFKNEEIFNDIDSVIKTIQYSIP
jgi:imidazole glycerol-phosphate synthase subunit HisF